MMDEELEIAAMDEDPGDTTCTICFAEFLDIGDLNIHIKQMHRVSVYVQCQFCEVKCSDMMVYASHIIEMHLICLKSCKYCSRMFLNSENCRQHENRHVKTFHGKYGCSQCSQVFVDVPELADHEYEKHKDAGEGVLLQALFPYLSSRLNINALKFIHSLGTDTVYICVHCELTTPNVLNYIEHLKQKDCQSYVCDKCSFVYKRKFGLVKHFNSCMDTHIYMGKASKRKCNDCLAYLTPNLFKQHKKHCKAIKCSTCNWVFETVDELTLHQTDYHPLSVTLQTCKFCNKQFVGTVALDKHVQRAHKYGCHLYKYVCIHCNSVFNHPKKLFCHFFSTHKDIEPYTCKICNEKYRLRKKFTLHIKLAHNSVGFVEFDENYHVFFTEKKSENPFKPTPVGSFMVESENREDKIDSKQEELQEKKVRFDDVNLDDFMEATDTEGNQTDKLKDVDKKNKLENAISENETDFLDPTETEGNQTDVEKPKEKMRKRKLKNTDKKYKSENEMDLKNDSSDDEPLLLVRKKVRKHRQQKLRLATWNRKKSTVKAGDAKRFTCNICDKYCYTYHNYHNHMSLHSKNESKKCIKCSRSFSSQEKLKIHMEMEHTSSKLTETLRRLMERRKNGTTVEEVELSTTEKFRKTIKRVTTDNTNCSVTVKPVQDDLSVQKFIESFTPEVNIASKKEIVIDTEVSLKPVVGKITTQPLIKLTKFEQEPYLKVNFQTKLAMPVKFKPDVGEKPKITIKIIPDYSAYSNPDNDMESSYIDDNFDQFEQEVLDHYSEIPEVAQEVLLEESEESKPMQVPHKIIIPNIQLPDQCKDITIAHLLPEAPYYKIVKVKDLLNESPKPVKPVETKPKESIKLPDGTKLVNVNPLAHLLGNTSVNKVLQNSRSKYYNYRSKSRDFETAIAKAMLKLEKPVTTVSKKKSKSNEYAIEQ
ncbi:zinc finger protein 423-like [Achroia grisella]|uniref:zinc finger protein 423-like n=1 Tax=Achroia grisella TaxID=688607 RepID=UPI0027D2D776|nr:zinc finger protein 423-like [Achroia grisella]